MNLPPKLPVTGPFRRLYGWLNELRDYSQSLRPIDSVGSETQQTAVGTIRTTRRTISDSANEINAPRWG